MTLAAVYARYSSDSQRDESIEIQVEHCTRLIERNGWSLGEVYTDFALTGKNDNRPAFQRCMADGLAGRYDVLVFYKRDRFARKVLDSRKYKEALQDKGIRIFSVREGESKNTPDGFLHEIMDEAFAEYYSLNLSVLIRDGIQKNAENCKASGVRIYGYDVDADDRFVPNPEEAKVVRHVFQSYVAGETTNGIAGWLKSKGVKTKRGNDWTPNSLLKMLHNDAYMGTYRYAGNVVPDGMPAIVDKGTFYAAQDILEKRKKMKRASVTDDYMLSEKMRCLKCGKSLCGTSGTGKSGRKYRYYGCMSKAGNCGFRIPADKAEETILGAVKELLADEETVEAMVGSIRDYAASQPDLSAQYAEERDAVLKRRDNLVASVADGMPASAVRDAVIVCEERLSELDMLIAREEFNKSKLLDEAEMRAFLAKFVDRADKDEDRAKLLVETFIDAIYADEEMAVVVFKLDDAEEVPFEEIQALSKGEHPLNDSSEGVRASFLWWSIGGSNP